MRPANGRTGPLGPRAAEKNWRDGVSTRGTGAERVGAGWKMEKAAAPAAPGTHHGLVVDLPGSRGLHSDGHGRWSRGRGERDSENNTGLPRLGGERGVCPYEDGLTRRMALLSGLTAALPRAAPNGCRVGEWRRRDAVLRFRRPGVSSAGNYSELLLPILTTILLLGARVVLLIVRRRSRSPYEQRCSQAGGSGAPTLPIHVRRSPRAYFTYAAALSCAHTGRTRPFIPLRGRGHASFAGPHQ